MNEQIKPQEGDIRGGVEIDTDNYVHRIIYLNGEWNYQRSATPVKWNDKDLEPSSSFVYAVMETDDEIKITVMRKEPDCKEWATCTDHDECSEFRDTFRHES